MGARRCGDIVVHIMQPGRARVLQPRGTAGRRSAPARRSSGVARLRLERDTRGAARVRGSRVRVAQPGLRIRAPSPFIARIHEIPPRRARVNACRLRGSPRCRRLCAALAARVRAADSSSSSRSLVTAARPRRADSRRRGAAHRRSDARAAIVVALDERGEAWTHGTLAEHLARLARPTRSSVAFVIGSADGLADSARRRNANVVMSLSALTLPHGLGARAARRAALPRGRACSCGHPYHRE